MPDARYLQNAPIIEALFDFQVKARAEFRPEEFSSLKDRLAARFPIAKERRGLQAKFSVVEGQGQPTVLEDLGLQGYFFMTADEKTIAQFRIDGFTFNRLSPYTRWDELFPLTMDLWDLYCSACRPEIATRLAVRYINRILLPSAPFDFDSYLRAAPVVPPELPQAVSGFVTRVTTHDQGNGVSANIAQALEPGTQGQQSSLILDIDAFSQREFPVGDPNIQRTFGQLRAFKNLIFFNSLTETKLKEFE